MTMSGAEFQCSREYLGLPAAWVADKLDVDRRTVYRWEQGKTKLPDWAASQMAAWLARTAQAVGKLTVAVMQAEGDLLATPDDGFEYMAAEGFPSSWQRMLCARAAERTGRRIRWMSLEDRVIPA